MGTQRLKNFRCETACHVVFEKLRFLDVGIARSLLQSIRILKLPDPIVGKPLKRILCVAGLSLRAILDQQRTQLAIDL